MINFNYKSYTGSEQYIFVLCGEPDREIAAQAANALVEAGLRVAFEVFDNKETNEASEIAKNIAKSKGTLVFLSEKSCGMKKYRNCINFVVDNPDPDLYVRLGGYVLKDGLEMKFASKDVIEFTDIPLVIARLKENEVVNSEMKAETGDMQPAPPDKKTRLKTLLIILAAMLALTALAWGVYRAVINRQAEIVEQQLELYQTDEYILTHINVSPELARYVDFSKYDKDSLGYLDGLVVGTLDLSGCGFTDISAVSGIDVSVVNLSGNPGIKTLEPLLECEHLQKVIVSADMYRLTGIFSGSDIIIEIR